MATVPAGQAPGSAHELPPSSPSPWPAIATQHTCGAVQVVVVQGIDPRAAVTPLPAALPPGAPPLLPPPRPSAPSLLLPLSELPLLADPLWVRSSEPASVPPPLSNAFPPSPSPARLGAPTQAPPAPRDTRRTAPMRYRFMKRPFSSVVISQCPQGALCFRT